MGGLAHYIEGAGIPTVVISLIRRHTEVMKPPRGLFVPFELGRPFGAANEPGFQRRVLLDALKMLERTDGPILEDFPDTPPDTRVAEDTTGWTCPVTLNSPNPDLSDTAKIILGLKQEVALLAPWYDETLKTMKGRRLDGLTTLSKEVIVDFLMAFVEDQSIASIVEGEGLIRGLKLAADDLRHYYYQAAMAKPGIKSDVELGNWFYGETLAGKLLIELRSICLSHSNESLQLIGRTNFVPNAMLKYV
mgnify:CR=1 FL=1